MPVPDFQTLMLPALQQFAQGKPVSNDEVYQALLVGFSLSEGEQQELLPSGKQTKFGNRIAWALSHLSAAGLLDSISRGVRRITPRGLEVLGRKPDRLDITYLKEFPEFRAFRTRRKASEADTGTTEDSADEHETSTPDEQLQDAFDAVMAPQRIELLKAIMNQPPRFFEELVLKLLRAMGFGSKFQGSATHLGQSGDGGLDGVIDEDALGLEQVYVQAKRYSADNAIGPSKIRDFAGALGVERARKGVFITTSRFTADAENAAERSDKRIVLIDGEELVELLFRYNVGVRTIKKLEIKTVDYDFFTDDVAPQD
jgi:restriction system protein